MKTFLHVLDRTLIHVYCITALLFLADVVAYTNASFEMVKIQARMLATIVNMLHGIST